MDWIERPEEASPRRMFLYRPEKSVSQRLRRLDGAIEGVSAKVKRVAIQSLQHYNNDWNGNF